MVAVRKGRILVMDDEEMVRRAIARLLESLGYHVGLAGDGIEAIELYHQARQQGRPFDLVIVDLAVPDGMGGQETMDRLRRDDPGVRAIVASGHARDPVMADYRAHGFRAAIRKPFDIDDLDRAIRQGLEAEI
jgi:two-component system cell cycle sensor histidine kinase/response regulator CckA